MPNYESLNTYAALNPTINDFKEGLATWLPTHIRADATERIQLTNSGTSAITAALLAIHNLTGKRLTVYLPAFHFHAAARAAINAGCRLAFLPDVDKRTGLLTSDTRLIESRLKPKDLPVVMPVDVFGLPWTPLDPAHFQELSQRVPFVFDSAQSFGSRTLVTDYHQKGVPLPSPRYGVMHCFSMSPTKPLTTGEGGFVLDMSPQKLYAPLIGPLTNRYGATDSGSLLKGGFSGRFAGPLAQVGIGSLRMFRSNLSTRHLHITTVRERTSSGFFDATRPFHFYPQTTDECLSSMAYFCVHCKTKEIVEALQKHLHNRGIQSRRYFYPLYFVPPSPEYAASMHLSDTTLALPCFNTITTEQSAHLIDALNAFVEDC